MKFQRSLCVVVLPSLSGYEDVVLARVLDEATVVNLNSIIHGNNGLVVSLLKDDNTFVQELFSRLNSSTTSLESKKIWWKYLLC
ncbi:hypothetical protein QN277_027318 [Acacia crassicarpa]|uniref:Serine/threonine-protein phosphatase 4 regulatory subunit 3-like central domain-containing protein n=1 Tax=Acacia crassicarpa TaxID=499986 RepID=A0AAE1JE31_9FABA|nr:hypothetical protein QN277_027318 [Acacia crassicarpa]